jgi:hypothetical protein
MKHLIARCDSTLLQVSWHCYGRDSTMHICTLCTHLVVWPCAHSGAVADAPGTNRARLQAEMCSNML